MANVTAVPAQMYVDPILDAGLMNIPLWFWVLIIIGVILIMTNFWWIYKWMNMRQRHF